MDWHDRNDVIPGECSHCGYQGAMRVISCGWPRQDRALCWLCAQMPGTILGDPASRVTLHVGNVILDALRGWTNGRPD